MEERSGLRGYLRRYNIIIQLLILIITLSSLAYYNYITQKRVLEQQLEIDTENIVQAMRASINKFSAINNTLNIQNQIRDISLGLDIFEFRFLDSNGVIINSMFNDEIGKIFQRPGFELEKIILSRKGVFYTDVRDYMPVLAVSRPVFNNDKLVGVLDLAVDLTEINYLSKNQKNIVLSRMEVDISNLLNAMAGSISNILKVFETLNYDDYLENYIHKTLNIIQVTIMDEQGKVYASSDTQLKGQLVQFQDTLSKSILVKGEQPVYRILAPLDPAQEKSEKLLLMIDAKPYIANEKRLLITALATGISIVIFSLVISYSIYRINLEREFKEKKRLEEMVKERTKEIEYLSQIDKLTGLFNRRHLEEIMISEFRRAMRFYHELSLIIVDLDNFKQINDTFGHLAGDKVLRLTGKVIRDQLRDTDFAGRYGGEEFVVLLPESGSHMAAVVAEKIRKAIEEIRIEYEGNEIPVTASLGVSTSTDDITDVMDILRQSDEALYQSKENGRNQVSLYQSK
ncbi:MAG: GGDEF domain-containing protein [Gammaproteobacteria bacterium]|nr:GGDEF domain-containing protein [Gammaproteobacteria bacterium]